MKMRISQLHYIRMVGVVLLFNLLLLGGIPQAFGAIIGFNPSPLTAVPGVPLVVDVIVSDLGPGLPNTISSFDLTISYDPFVLAPAFMMDPVTFGTELGGPFDSLQDFDLSTSGIVNISELSFLPFFFQPSSFTLATLTFDPLGMLSEATTIAFTGNQIVLDDFGTSFQPTEITFQSSTAVPLPDTATLFLIGIMGLLIFRRLNIP